MIKGHAILAIMGVLAFTFTSAAGTEGVFPGETWETKMPVEVGLDPAKLDAFRDYVGGRGCIIRHGYLVYTWGDYTRRSDVASAAKPVYTHFLFKALAEQNISSLDEKVADWVPALNEINADLNYKDRDIVWRHMANQTSCYGVTADPGTAFNYNDYQMALFIDTLFEKVYGVTYAEVDQALLHAMLGDLIGFEDNPTFLAFGLWDRPGRLAISPRDFARFGLLYLHKGKWDGNQVLDETLAVTAVSDPLPNSIPMAVLQAAEMIPGQRSIGELSIPHGGTDHHGSYSWLWWLNGINRGGNRHMPAAPHDVFGAYGHNARRAMIVLPGLDLIVSWNDTNVNGWAMCDHALGMLAGSVLDDEPPSVPTDVSATTLSWTSIEVTWTASTDNVGVVGYRVFRDGVQVGTTTTTSYTDTGLPPGTTYSYTVSAYDAAGNHSAQSSPPAVAATPADDEPPSVPTDVQATALSPSSISLSWTASTDNAGVAGYRIFRDGSPEPVGTSPTTSYTDSDLQPNTTYAYRVSAYDLAQNESELSAEVSATTLPLMVGHQWHWNADNWSAAAGTWVSSATSQWAEPDQAATVQTGGQHNHRYMWTAPGTAILGNTSGVITVNMPGGQNARGMLRTNNLWMTEVDDPESPKYWNAYTGITFATKVYVDSTGPYGRRNIWLCVSNLSTSGVGSRPGVGIMVGWDLQAGDRRVWIGNDMGSTWRIFDSTIPFKDRWSTWTISARRIGNTMGWKLWIDGVPQAADQELDGDYYTYVGFQDKSNTPDVSYYYVGVQEPQGSPHTSHWSHVAITNAGEVPGWNGLDLVAGILPTITGHPSDQSKYVGETATFSVTATGAEGYQWQVNDGSGWEDIEAATDPAYPTPTLTAADDGNQYRCVVWNDYGSVKSDPATLTVTVLCTEPVLLSAYSVMTHGAAGDFAVEIDFDEPYAVEPRMGSQHRLEFVFDQPIYLGVASVTLSSGSVADLALASTTVTDDTLVATLAEQPDNNACLTIEVGGVKDVTGACVMAPTTFYLAMIQGDVDGSPPVNLTDLSVVRAELYQPVTINNFMSDVNADGVINLTDLSLVRDNLYQQATCP